MAVKFQEWSINPGISVSISRGKGLLRGFNRLLRGSTDSPRDSVPQLSKNHNADPPDYQQTNTTKGVR